MVSALPGIQNGVPFVAPFGAIFGAPLCLPLEARPRPATSRFPVFTFQDNYFSNSIPAPASGLEKVRAGSARILVFSLLSSRTLFNTTTPGPAGQLEN